MFSLGLLGKNISYSYSARVFEDIFKKNEIVMKYKILDVDNFSALRSILAKSDFYVGYNVTIPYKITIIKLLDSVSDEALQIGSVNTVVNDSNIGLCGYNTDSDAFKSFFIDKKKRCHNKALILGSGGAARAVAFAFSKINVDYLILSRNKDLLTNHNKKDFLFDGRVVSYYESLMLDFNDYNIIVNATPSGTLNTSFTLNDIFPFYKIKEGSLMVDLVYNPDITPFMIEGIKKQCYCFNGFEILRLQAELAWSLYFSKELQKKRAT